MTTRLAKPMDSQWTDDQWEAIITRGDNILVAAAAGSGKTAVLIERILRLITSEQQPVDVDRLLVATFTKAAADEMRHRMREALEKRLLQDPDSAHVRRQLALIHRASFTTLHSFCMDVISRYAHQLPLDPSFRVANETEAELLRQDAIEELFEQAYSEYEPDNPFWGLLDRYGGERSDDAIYSLVMRLYDYSRSHPFPDQWLNDCAEQFGLFEPTDDNAIAVHIIQDTKLVLEGVQQLLMDAYNGACSPGGPHAYAETIMEELVMTGRLLALAESGQWDELYNAFQNAAFGRLKPAKGDDLDASKVEAVKSLRDKAKKQLADTSSTLFSRPPAELALEMTELTPYMKALVALVIQFGERYAAAKTAKRLVDFSDLEHYCLQLLCEGVAEDGTLLPTRAALDYQEQFEEVLIDEYQDTNQVQEAVLSLISRSNPGNRFMVGDVKQSIYRFRLADPGIFLAKYKAYRNNDTSLSGAAIDLSRNFRSRSQVVDGVNYIFKQLMEERAAEITYDEKAELVYGAGYPDSPAGAESAAVDMYLVHRNGAEQSAAAAEDGDTADSSEDEGYELETAELEARLIAMRIKELVGSGDNPPFQVVADRASGTFRNVTYRDIVILLRATQAWSPVFIEQLRAAGIPAYAELSTGYFEAVEVDVMLSLLKIIDNPLQDIPLAGVLRSPIVGLSAEQLAQIRLANRSAPFFEALQTYLSSETNATSDVAIRSKLTTFMALLEQWRQEARNGALSDLLWRIYRETGYFDYVGGLPGGTQRQANLKALYDRSRQFEATSLHGLFRFLRFIERMQDSGGDLGAAKALGEQEDVVRIMSIHKSKGLEFPVVFVAGMAKMFNQRDLSGDFLLHKELGFGPLIVDPSLRVSYPSAAALAIKRKLRMEMLAEELRILYVALTRAKEKLILIGTTRNIEQQFAKWQAALREKELLLPAHLVTSARSYLDWVGPAVLRHPSLHALRGAWKLPETSLLTPQASQFQVHIISQSRMLSWQEAAAGRQAGDEARMARIAALEPVELTPSAGFMLPESALRELAERSQSVADRLAWMYPFAEAERYYSKTSVTEVKRMQELTQLAENEAAPAAPLPGLSQAAPAISKASFRRPRFMTEVRMTAAERGTVYHAVMQQLPLQPIMDASHVKATIGRMVALEMLSEKQAEAIDISPIVDFFQTDIGQRLLRSAHVRKEQPFSYGLRVSDLHPEASPEVGQETVLIQGVIDCLFEEEDGLVLLDYKTDKIIGSPEQAAAKYETQLALYAIAIQAIVGREIKQKVLYFFDGAHLVVL